jgi:hypothetical protein
MILVTAFKKYAGDHAEAVSTPDTLLARKRLSRKRLCGASEWSLNAFHELN